MMGFGQVRHTRLRPKHHAFNYNTFFLMLPMRTLQASGDAVLPINRTGAISFHDVDHGDGRQLEEGGTLAWLDELLHSESISDATGEVWLHCYPRVLGYTFKPVSFWYCHRAADDQGGALRAVVVEVAGLGAELTGQLVLQLSLAEECSLQMHQACKNLITLILLREENVALASALLLGACAPGQPMDPCAVERIAQVPLDMAEGLPRVTVAINGRPATMLLDTGANAVILTPAAARRLAPRGRLTECGV